jgi:hypothetical protein
MIDATGNPTLFRESMKKKIDVYASFEEGELVSREEGIVFQFEHRGSVIRGMFPGLFRCDPEMQEIFMYYQAVTAG